MDVHRAVGMAVEPSHQQTSCARSIDAIRNSSPLTSVDVGAAAGAAHEDREIERRGAAARTALDHRRDVVDRQRAARQLGAVGQQLPGEHEGVGDDLAEVADAHLDPFDPPAVGVARDGVDDRLAQRELVHHASFPAHCADTQPGDGDALAVDHEPRARLDELADGLQRRLRDLADGATPRAHEVSVAVVGPVVDGRVAVELERSQHRELDEELEGPVHGGAVRSRTRPIDRGQDLGRGEVVAAGVEDRARAPPGGRE